MPGLVTEVQGDVNPRSARGRAGPAGRSQVAAEYQEASNGLSAAQAALAQAQALKKAAKLAVAYQTDINAKGGFRSELEQAAVKLEAAEAGVSVAQSQVQVSKTALEKAEEALAKTVIKLPANCGQVSITAPATCRKFYVLERHVQLGQFVTQGAPLFLVTAEPRNMEVHAEVAEADMPRFASVCRPRFPCPPTATRTCSSRAPFGKIRPQGVNSKGAVYYVAVVEVANKKDPASGEWLLRPGMTASIDVIRRKHEKVWSMPVDALNFQMDDAYLNKATRGRIAQWNRAPTPGNGEPSGRGMPPRARRSRSSFVWKASTRTANRGSRTASSARSWNGSRAGSPKRARGCALLLTLRRPARVAFSINL